MKLKINQPTDIVTRKVTLCGISPIMFDRYAGDNKTQLEPTQKLYLSPEDSKTIGLPAINIMSLLSAHNTNSAPKRLRDKRKYKDICNACAAFVEIGPLFLPFKRDGQNILFLGLDKNEIDSEGSKIYLHRSVARLKDGIPNPKVRPVLPLPWSLEFDFKLYPNKEIKEQEIINLLEEAGFAIGLGTYRGVFGKYRIESWE